MLRTSTAFGLALLLLASGSVPAATAQPSLLDDGVIRLGAAASLEPTSAETEKVRVEAPRRGFDYDSFQSRIESLWFQRKTFLANQRYEDADEQLERIRAFSAEEGVLRLEQLAGALLCEAQRAIEEGNYDHARTALRFSEAFDAGRPQVHLARAEVHRKSDADYLAAAGDLLRAVRASIALSIRQLSLFHELLYVLGAATFCCMLAFALLMLFRYQIPFRHEIEEWSGQFCGDRWPVIAGWAALLLPLLSWIAAGWTAVYWIVITFRFMTRSERLAALALLASLGLVSPLNRVTVSLYGTTADPAVRTTLSSVGGDYNPDRIVKLRQLVARHESDPVYHFLLAGLYKNGRYFEEAFDEYKLALQLDPNLSEAYINIGNIFYTTGQFGEAVANYRRAIEIDDESFLAHFNMHVAQSEAFRFQAAEQSLDRAKQIDTSRVAELLSSANKWGERPKAHDAWVGMASVWESALGHRSSAGLSTLDAAPSGPGLLNPVSIVALLAILVCAASALLVRSSSPARRCIRCGRPFCQHCKSGREAQEYCSQCVHLYVLGDGLAPGTKSRKLYEVERHERYARRIRRLLSLLLPGTAQLARGRALWGTFLILTWFAMLISMRPAVLAAAAGWIGIELRPDLLRAPEVPALYDSNPLFLLASMTVPVIWITGNAWRRKRREV